jgi:hypothetical protein
MGKCGSDPSRNKWAGMGFAPVVFTEVRQIKEFRRVLEVWKEKELEGDSLDLWQVKELADCGVRFTQKYSTVY